LGLLTDSPVNYWSTDFGNRSTDNSNILGFNEDSNYRSTDTGESVDRLSDYCSLLLSGWDTVAYFTVSVDRSWKIGRPILLLSRPVNRPGRAATGERRKTNEKAGLGNDFFFFLKSNPR
jgi:hypothetical protein